jgi:hypothetical protein
MLYRLSMPAAVWVFLPLPCVLSGLLLATEQGATLCCAPRRGSALLLRIAAVTEPCALPLPSLLRLARPQDVFGVCFGGCQVVCTHMRCMPCCSWEKGFVPHPKPLECFWLSAVRERNLVWCYGSTTVVQVVGAREELHQRSVNSMCLFTSTPAPPARCCVVLQRRHQHGMREFAVLLPR